MQTAQLATLLQGDALAISAMRANQVDAPIPQTLAKGVGIGRLVINETLGLLPPPTPTWHRFQEVSQRNTLAVCHPHPLRTFAFLGLADTGPPFLAGAKLPSAKFSAQWSCP